VHLSEWDADDGDAKYETVEDVGEPDPNAANEEPQGDADDGYHQYQSCDEILQGYVQAPEYDPDDVS